MHDEKRFLRELKRTIKKAGNRKRRRYLKDPAAAADEFSFGRDRTDVMNEKPRQTQSLRTQFPLPCPGEEPTATNDNDPTAGRPAPSGPS